MSQIIPIVVAVLPVAAPFLVALYRYLVSQLPQARQAQVQSVVKSAVVAAEQLYKAVPGSAQDKRSWVITRVQMLLGKRVPVALIEVLLEEAVATLPK